jgi:hypothetical protein
MSSYDDDTDYADRFYRGARPFALTPTQQALRDRLIAEDAKGPAAPTRTEACPFGGVCEKMAKVQDALARTEAEQAVLDAMAEARINGASPTRPCFFHDEDEMRVCGAELARRGLKP